MKNKWIIFSYLILFDWKLNNLKKYTVKLVSSHICILPSLKPLIKSLFNDVTKVLLVDILNVYLLVFDQLSIDKCLNILYFKIIDKNNADASLII